MGVIDKLFGGKADGIPDSKFDSTQLQKGTQVETEHTKDKSLAKEIAKDHLTEDKDYYKKLERMEDTTIPDQTVLDKDMYFRIGRKNGLEGDKLDRYVKFMVVKYPNETSHEFARVWADRFRTESEMRYADTTGKRILAKMVSDEEIGDFHKKVKSDKVENPMDYGVKPRMEGFNSKHREDSLGDTKML